VTAQWTWTHRRRLKLETCRQPTTFRGTALHHSTTPLIKVYISYLPSENAVEVLLLMAGVFFVCLQYRGLLCLAILGVMCY